MGSTYAEICKAPRDAVIWQRPSLPSRHEGAGPYYALLMFVISVGFLLWPLFSGAGRYSGSGLEDYSGEYIDSYSVGMGVMLHYAIAAPLAFVFFLFGLVIISVTYILREIRQAAYEAAIRAGEVRLRS